MVSATVTVICYKWKTLSNGENPLMLRITKERMLRTYKTSRCEYANTAKSERHNFQHSADKRNAQRGKKEISFTRWQFLLSLITQDIWQIQVYIMSGENAELALVKLIELFNRSGVAITKRYLGLRQEEILEAYVC